MWHYKTDLLRCFDTYPQRREEEKNQMNNKDSSNHIMKDLEELLPKKPVIQLSTKDSTEGNAIWVF